MHAFRFVLSALLFAASLIQTAPHSYAVTSEGKPTSALLSLLSALSITHDGTLESIVAATQKEQPGGFLRARGKERWELESFFEKKKEIILDHANQLHLIEAVQPLKKQYEYAVILGATINSVRNRIGFLIDLWQSGVRWKKLIIFAGNRPLDPTLESKEQLINATNGYTTFKKDWQLTTDPKIETDMARMVLDQSLLPNEWKQIPVEIINCPMNKDGSRPTTFDTIQFWLSTKPEHGSILAISNQPYIGYQDVVLRSQLPNTFTLEMVGRGSKNTTPELLLDTIARWLYNIKPVLQM